MEIEDLELLITEGEDVPGKIISENPSQFDPKQYKEYDVANHSVNSKSKRKDKDVFKPTGKKNTDGTEGQEKTIVRVNRLPIPLQKILVRRAAAFIVGGKVKLIASIKKGDAVGTRMLTSVSNTWKDNKLNFKNKALVKKMLSETECAEIWYTDTKIVKGKEVKKLKMTMVSPSMGNTLYPVFDAVGDMIAFGYSFETKTQRFFNLYTDTHLYKYIQNGAAAWELQEDGVVELPYGKIPVIYYGIENPFWYDVQQLIERLETLLSNHADTDDYNGSPILKMKGKVEGMAAKGEAGKAFQLAADADISYVTWDNAPLSIVEEGKSLRTWIFGGVSIPDLSPEFLSSLGGDISGAALDRILIDGHLLAADFQDGVYGECLQRRNNLLVAMHITNDETLASAEGIDVQNEFTLFRINDEGERINNAILANGGKPVISQKSSVAYADLTGDPDAEWILIQAEEDALANTSGTDE